MADGVEKKLREKEDKLKGLQKMLDDLNNKKCRLELILEAGADNVKEIEAELATVNLNMKYISARLMEAQAEYEKVRAENEKKKKQEQHDNKMKAHFLLEKAQKIEDEKKEILERKEEEKAEKFIEELFDSTEFIHVSKDQVESIINNPEFQEKNYATKLRHNDIEVNLEYRFMIERELVNAGCNLTGNRKEDERLYIKRLKEPNEFEIALKKLIKQDELMMKDPEDAKKYQEILALMKQVSEETRKAQNKFLQSGRDCLRDNGYSKEMIDHEKKLQKKVWDFVKDLSIRMNREVDNNNAVDDRGEDVHGTVSKFAVMKEITFHIDKQAKIDECLQRNNALREKIEMWYIYDKIKGRTYSSVKNVKDLIEGEEKAWSKPAKLKRQALGKSTAVEFTGEYAMIETQTLIERINEHREFNKNELKMARITLAALVIHEIIKKESAESNIHKQPYTVRFMQRPDEERFLSMAEKLAESKEFDNILKEVGIKKITPKNCVKFLVEDTEKNIVKMASKLFENPKDGKKKAPGTEPDMVLK